MIYINLAQNSQHYHTHGASTSDGAGTSDSKANEPVPESGVKEGLESYSDSDSGARITSPLMPTYTLRVVLLALAKLDWTATATSYC